MHIDGYRIRGLVPVLVLIALAACLGGCASGRSYRSYVTDGVEPEKADLRKVEFYVAALDSLDVHKHRFPTGYEAAAPNLDPRNFLLPDDIAVMLDENLPRPAQPLTPVGRPPRPFQVVGEVIAELAVDRYASNRRSGQLQLTATVLDTLPKASHEKYFRALSDVDWEETMKRFRASVEESGADAVIEIFCGAGVERTFTPPSHTFIPMGTATLSVMNPGGFGSTGWEIRGLAVRWAD